MKRVLLAALLLVAAATPAATYTVTAYCACVKCCGADATGRTASGQRPRQGVTVAGPRNVPLGARVQIAGVGARVVQDRLARRFNHRFDVYFTNHDRAIQFGKRRLRVTILK